MSASHESIKIVLRNACIFLMTHFDKVAYKELRPEFFKKGLYGYVGMILKACHDTVSS
jgi:hypothetical protein